jgi:hypothetical protein
MPKREPTAEQFLKDVANHKMAVLHNDGIYRHIEFRSADSGWHLWFALVTWPGFLTICGVWGIQQFDAAQTIVAPSAAPEVTHA